MKKAVGKIVLCVFLAVSLLCTLTGCGNRAQILKIYNWGEYMNPDVYEGFSDWYFEKTGEKVVVKYKEFDTNETMFTEISVNKADYDLVCPSDYMIERMKKAGLLQKIDGTVLDLNEEGLFYDGLTDMVKKAFDENLEYTVPYVWGTFGIMYDVSKVSNREDMTSWEAMFSEKYHKKILMKNSVRDAYSVAQIYNHTDVLSEASSGFTDYNDDYRAALEGIFSTVSDETVRQAQETLVAQKRHLIRYEVDDGKDDMLSGNTDAQLGLFWSCDAGYVMNDMEVPATGCAAESVIPGNKNLFYSVPKEGSNVWVDGFVIPKYAKNVKAANYFLQYICDTDVAKENMDWLGSSVAVKGAMDLSLEEYAEDDEFFADTPDGFKEMYLEMMFPTEEVLRRCAIMKDFGDYNFQLDGMWIDVKTA